MPPNPQRRHQSGMQGCLSSCLFICESGFWMPVPPCRGEDHTVVDNVVMDVKPRKLMWHECGSSYKNGLRAEWDQWLLSGVQQHRHSCTQTCTETTGLWYAWEQQILLTGLIFIVNFILTYSLQPFLPPSPVALLSLSVCVSLPLC